MAGGKRYRGSRPRKRGGCGWALMGFLLLCALLLCYGQSQPLIRLREQVSARLEGIAVYEDAVAQVGKFFSGVEQERITSVFGQLFFGGEQAAE